MITINYRGRYGNNLFQLSAANLISKRHNKTIISEIRSNILKTHQPENYFDNTTEIVVNDTNFINLYNDSELQHRNIILTGFFQRPEIISEFIKHNEYFTDQNPKDNTFVHIRLGDFVKNGMSLDYSFYEKALSKINTENTIIATNDESHDIVKKILDKYDASLIKDTPENTILFGASCENKVLSLGTFSWWVGFLGSILHGKFIKTTICPDHKRHNLGKIFPMFDWMEI